MQTKFLAGCLALSLSAGCAVDKNPLAVNTARTSASIVGANTKFWAWSWYGNSFYGPITTQPYNTLNASQFRQVWTGVGNWYVVGDWAAVNPGKRYIVGDEPELHVDYAGNPAGYATDYCGFVTYVRGRDPSASFGPAGFSHLVENWYLDAFYSAYQSGPCSSVPIAEWTFHKLGEWYAGLADFQNYVAARASWSVNHGAPMVLGSWSLDQSGVLPDGHPYYVDRLTQARAWLASQSNIILTRYLLFEPYGEHHPLADMYGNLTPEGVALAGSDPRR